MNVTLTKEANGYLNQMLIMVAETNSVNRHLKRKLDRLAGRFNPDHDTVNLKKEDALALARFLTLAEEVCDGVLQNGQAPKERIELATKKKEIISHVQQRISKAFELDPR
jgi:hypothetical protein